MIKFNKILYYFKVIFVHAALRQRNLMNKLTNKKEQLIGISRTPMGFLLQQLGATNEIAS